MLPESKKPSGNAAAHLGTRYVHDGEAQSPLSCGLIGGRERTSNNVAAFACCQRTPALWQRGHNFGSLPPTHSEGATKRRKLLTHSVMCVHTSYLPKRCTTFRSKRTAGGEGGGFILTERTEHSEKV